MKTIYMFICFAFILIGCEDTKKHQEPSVNTIQEEQNTPNDNAKSKPEKQDTKPPIQKRFPKITNSNVEEFLTSYGKENPETKVLFETRFGAIEIQLYRNTPLHRANFIYLIKQGYFDDTFFHRVVPNFIIQAGSSDLVSTQSKRNRIGNDYLIPAEIAPDRVHEYGSVSGAKHYRANPDHRSAPFEFFIFFGPQNSASHINGSYTIFGHVTKGMDVVEKIAEVETDSDDWPIDNIYIKATVLE